MDGDYSVSTTETNGFSQNQPSADTQTSPQSYENTPANTNTSTSTENRSESQQMHESGNSAEIASGRSGDGKGSYVLVEGSNGKRTLLYRPSEVEPQNTGGENKQLQTETYQQPTITGEARQIGEQLNQTPQTYTLNELSNAIASGDVDERRVPEQYQQQYANWKINQAIQNYNAVQQAQVEQRQQLERQLSPEEQRSQMREFYNNLDIEASKRAAADVGFTEEDVENIDLMDESDESLINYKLAKEWRKNELIQNIQRRYATEAANRERQAKIYQGISDFAAEQKSKEPNFDAIDRFMTQRIEELPYRQAKQIQPVFEAFKNGTITEEQTIMLRNYYEDTRKAYYAKTSGLSTTPRKAPRPPQVEHAGDGRVIENLYRPDYSALAQSDIRGRRAWLAEYIRNRNK